MNKKLKLVGIPAWDLKQDEYFGVTHPYLVWITKDLGCIPVIITPDYMPAVDLLVLPGGLDVDPKRYGETPDYYTSKPNLFLEHFDRNYLPKYIKQGTPVFGICRGLQTLNVHFGGTLNQDILNHPTSSRTSGPVDLVHDVFNVEFGIKSKTPAFKAGSWHHQSVKDLGEGLEVLLLSHDDHVEALKHETLPVFAVQFHPERMNDSFSYNIVKYLLGEKENWK